MDFALFLKACLIGLSIAAPVGPIGLLCIQRTLSHGQRVGFMSGLGAATADACYGALGAFSVAAVTSLFVALRWPLALAGGLFLGWMGLQMLRQQADGDTVAPATSTAAPGSLFKAYLSVLALTLTNPMTILSFSAIFAALGGDAGGSGSPFWMVVGVFLGSALWWLGLSFVVARLRHRVAASSMRRINQISGAVLLAFALWQLASLF